MNLRDEGEINLEVKGMSDPEWLSFVESITSRSSGISLPKLETVLRSSRAVPLHLIPDFMKVVERVPFLPVIFYAKRKFKAPDLSSCADICLSKFLREESEYILSQLTDNDTLQFMRDLIEYSADSEVLIRFYKEAKGIKNPRLIESLFSNSNFPKAIIIIHNLLKI